MGRGGATQSVAGTGGAGGKTEPEPSLDLVAWRPMRLPGLEPEGGPWCNALLD